MKKVLIVDDEKICLMMTDHILSTKYETLMASSGHEAIEIFRKEQPDMILTDLRMPHMSGFELFNTIQDMYAEPIPFMFMTADGTDETESESFAKGAIDYIEKPFRADVLLSRVERALKHVDYTNAARKDPMTGLLNKAASQDEIGNAARKTNGALLMLDLDSFKLVNDLYGHNMGDKILIRFSEIIRSALRNTDIVGRMGGDEFIAFCKDVHDDEVIAKKAEYINEELLKSAYEFMGEDMTIPLGTSVGAVFAPEEGTDFLTLYTKADKALYKVKQNGKHGYFVFREEREEEKGDEEELSDAKKVMAVLAERNRPKGAFHVSMEQFTSVYRFLSRMELNYRKGNKICIFSLEKLKEDTVPLSEAREAFLHIAKSSLRASDVVTESSRNHVYMLLLEADKPFSDMVAERIINKWQESDLKDGYAVTYEMEIIE